MYRYAQEGNTDKTHVVLKLVDLDQGNMGMIE